MRSDYPPFTSGCCSRRHSRSWAGILPDAGTIYRINQLPDAVAYKLRKDYKIFADYKKIRKPLLRPPIRVGNPLLSVGYQAGPGLAVTNVGVQPVFGHSVHFIAVFCYPVVAPFEKYESERVVALVQFVGHREGIFG